jgi:hypothetical protein
MDEANPTNITPSVHAHIQATCAAWRNDPLHGDTERCSPTLFVPFTNRAFMV